MFTLGFVFDLRTRSLQPAHLPLEEVDLRYLVGDHQATQLDLGSVHTFPRNKTTFKRFTGQEWDFKLV